MSSDKGSCHPGLLVVTGATTIAALAACVVFTFAAELLHENTDMKVSAHQTSNKLSVDFKETSGIYEMAKNVRI